MWVLSDHESKFYDLQNRACVRECPACARSKTRSGLRLLHSRSPKTQNGLEHTVCHTALSSLEVVVVRVLPFLHILRLGAPKTTRGDETATNTGRQKARPRPGGTGD